MLARLHGVLLYATNARAFIIVISSPTSSSFSSPDISDGFLKPLSSLMRYLVVSSAPPPPHFEGGYYSPQAVTLRPFPFLPLPSPTKNPNPYPQGCWYPVSHQQHKKSASSCIILLSRPVCLPLNMQLIISGPDSDRNEKKMLRRLRTGSCRRRGGSHLEVLTTSHSLT